ncbi:hypothetical protein F8A86_09115 [Betaproteobacteria bacterium SCN1]|jgi:hypothetical protein|nr:hypothetical protein F8A86_09115 [Betaproteobacteria bacterium SCN1]MBN8760976.1 hypothetical protein [Thiobacillus sp.]OJW36032.1 MAG: hypothetical protein BGO61_08835 [Thiobacillus sp. 65-69]
MKRTLPLPRLLPGPAWPPRALRWVASDIAGVARQPEQDHRTHLRASVEWLCRAQDSARQEGLSEGWSFAAGWLPATPAATAALVETLLPAADYLVWPELKGRARALCGILLAQPDAASAGRVLGLIAAGMQLGETGALDRAAASGRLLVDAPFESPAACAHAAQALAMLGQVTGERFFFEGARACLARVARAATPCGWFPGPHAPVTTTQTATALRGLVEAARGLEDTAGLRLAVQGARALREQLEPNGRLAGAHDDGWAPVAGHACIAGLARMACVWLRLAQIENDAVWRDAAWRALAWIKRNQRQTGDDLALRDGLPAAVPIWGGAVPFRLDSLTLKYFADALMMDMVGIAIPPTEYKPA